MNLFFKKVFGGLTPTDKFEKEEEDLLLAYKRYCDIQTSEQLKEYTQLFHLVKAADFQEKKKTLQNRKFKDTEEYRDFRKYEKLHNSLKMRLYYEVRDSEELKEFLAFKGTAEYEKLGKPKEVKADERLKRFKSYEKSKRYRNYIRLNGSFLVTEYEKLKALVATEEFQKSKAWWEDKNRWQKTEEYKTEQRYYDLQKTPDISFYERTNPKSFLKLNEWALTFSDDFSGNALNAQWQNGFYHRATAIKRIYSFSNEKQACTNGKNVEIANNSLCIKTIAEKAEGIAWDAKKGFIKKDCDFTSGTINTGEAFQQQYGLIKAKIRINGSKDVSHAFWLSTDGRLPHINIFNFNGKNISVANCAKNGEGIATEKESIKGISPSNFYIYSLEWTPKELIWKINNVEVKRTAKNIPSQAMFLSLGSFISAKNKGGNSVLNVEWVKVFTKKGK